jgi:NAD+ synthase/NAD+ synthase (glutamine-hydrolysing)
MLTLSLAQLDLIVGDLPGNVTRMTVAARKAAANGAQIVVFTELSLTGYPPAGLLAEPAFLARVDAALMKLCDASRVTPNLYWVIGAPTRRRPDKALENSLLVLKNGQIVLQYAKRVLQTRGMFDERRYFVPGPDVTACLEIGGKRVGFLIGEDARNDESKDDSPDPLGQLAAERPGLGLVIVIDANPSHINTRREHHARMTAASHRHGLPMVIANQVGGRDQLVFDGASFAATPNGIAFEAARFEETVTTLRLQDGMFLAADGGSLAPVPATGLPLMEFYRSQIVLGLSDYIRHCGFTKVVVGSSGGLDSALVLALAAEAINPENVIAITLPSRFSSLGSVSDSATLCRNLGVKLFEHPIRDLVATYEQGFNSAFGEPLKKLTLENLQARVRGTVLMEYSNQFGALLLTTGNKSETSIGYCTLYGDTNGSLAPIGDLYKTEVIKLSQHINETAGRELIPEAIINKPPSAELAPGQKDSDSLPPYPVLDTILKTLNEGGHLCIGEQDETEAAWNKLTETKDGTALIARVQQMIWKSEFKRRQSAPVLYLRPRPFGSERQLPVAARYEHLSSAIPAFYGGDE